MYGCSNYVGCLSVSASRIGKGIKANVNLLNEGLSVSASRVGQGLIVDCSIVCTINKTAYLYVDPTILWLTPEMLANADFDITSNTSWTIE